MAFGISDTARKAAEGGGKGGGFLGVSKLGDGESYRVAIVSDDPFESWTVWGESGDKKKPFRFTSEPSAADIEAELGDYTQRMSYDGDKLEPPKFSLAFFVFDYSDSQIKVFEIPQKTLIKEIDKLSKDEDYQNLHEWDLKFSRAGLKLDTVYSILPSPRKAGSQKLIDATWKVAQDQGADITALLVGGNPFGEKL